MDLYWFSNGLSWLLINKKEMKVFTKNNRRRGFYHECKWQKELPMD